MPSRAKIPGNLGLVAFDVDGVLTDGSFWLSDDGVESKAFNTQDGFGIRQLLRAGLEVAVISGRQSNAVEKRMSELGVTRNPELQRQSNRISDADQYVGHRSNEYHICRRRCPGYSAIASRRSGDRRRKCSCGSESGKCADDKGVRRAWRCPGSL